MSDKDEKRPIILVKKIKKGGGHHGGAWKVAYADFVTAMMAFFMVMWLIASVNKETRAAIFDYFKNPSMEKGNSPKAAPGQMGPGGASTSVINMRGGLDARKSSSPLSTGLGTPTNGMTDHPTMSKMQPGSEEAKKQAAEAERQKLESLMAELKAAIGKSQALAPYKDQLLLDVTPEGLRIQVVDAQNRPMFDLGSSQLKSYSADIMKSLAPYLNTVPNHISLAGHTDTTPFVAQGGYNNWDLSTDRANAARRALESGGLEQGKVSRVVGLSSSVLFDKENARDPINRRISIIVMTQEAEASALKTDTATEIPVETATEALRKVEGGATGEGTAAASAAGGAAGGTASGTAGGSAGEAAAESAPAAAPPAAPPGRPATGPAFLEPGGSGTPNSIPIIQVPERPASPAH